MKEANFVKIFESKKNCSKKIFKTVENVKVFSMISFFFFEGWGGGGRKIHKKGIAGWVFRVWLVAYLKCAK